MLDKNFKQKIHAHDMHQNNVYLLHYMVILWVQESRV